MSYSKEFFSDIRGGSLNAAEVVIPLLVKWFRPSSVLDVGCGSGMWLEAFQREGVDDIWGIDGADPTSAKVNFDETRYRQVDLEDGWQPPASVDLALCLEVAEHISAQAGERLIRLLTSSAPVVVFSAAIPFQGGRHHVNERWQHEWAAEFSHYGQKTYDCIRPRLWGIAESPWWYAQNMLVFCNRSILGELHPEVQASEVSTLERLSVVHPRHYLVRVDPRQLARRDAAHTLVRAVHR